MNREQIEEREICREIGRVPKEVRRFEVLIEIDPGTMKGKIRSAHGFDDIGTFFYRKAHKRPGYRYRQYDLFPHDKLVKVIEHG